MTLRYLHSSCNHTHALFIVSLFVFVSSASFAQSVQGIYPIQNFSPSDYKAGIQNIDFAQNRDMQIFVANNLCVLSFNGTEWGRYNYKNGKKNRSLVFDERLNRLYVGAQGEIGYFEEDWSYISLTSAIPESNQDFDEVWDVFLQGEKVYFCTFQGIYIYDGNAISIINHPDGLERCFSVNGKIFVQSQQSVLYEINGASLSPVFEGAPLKEVLTGMIPYDQGYLLFYNSGEVAYRTQLQTTLPFPTLTRALKGSYVNHVLQLSDQRLAISTQAAGLFLFNPQTGITEQITAEAGLAANACLRSFQDYQGNLWVGMQNGIALIHLNSPMRLIGKRIGIQGSGYEGFETEEGAYFTTSSGIYFLPKGAAKSTFLKGTEGPAYGIERIGGRIYAGHHRGLFLLENGTARQIAETDGIWTVKPLKSNPSYAIGGTYFGLYLFRINDTQLLEPLYAISGFDLSSRFFEEDQQGNIWVGQYYKGVYKLQLSADMLSVQAEAIHFDAFPLANEQVALVRAKEQLHLATSIGLFQLDPKTNSIQKAPLFTAHNEEQPVYLVAQDKKNNIHLLCDNEAGFYHKISKDNYQYHSSSLYQLRYHLNNDLLHASVNIENGILFSANEGFVHYLPERETQQNTAQPIITQQVYNISEDEVLFRLSPFSPVPDTPTEISVHPGAKVIQFSIEAFQFSNLNDTKFRYFLKGFDERYGPWSNTTSKEYTNLKAGKYEFVVQAKGYMGQVITSQPVYLTVNPPFYKSRLAKLLYTLIVISTLIAFSSIQRKRYQRKAQEMEQQQKQELKKEQQKLSQIEEEKQETLIRLKREKVDTELQHVSNLLAASTMNLVVKNEFIDSIKQELHNLRENGKWSEAKQTLEKIEKEIDTNLRLQEDWEQFEYHFDKVHGDFLSRLQHTYPDLSPNEQKLCTLLRLNLNTKEIANMLSISQRGVEVARYRLRKKLNLEKGQNLSKFILEY